MGIQQIDGQSPSYQANFAVPNTTDRATDVRTSSAPAAGGSVQQQNTVTHASFAQLEKAVAQAQARMRDAGSDLSFSIDKESGKTVVKLIDPATQEVIRQIPSKEMLEISHNLDKAIQGLLIHQRA